MKNWVNKEWLKENWFKVTIAGVLVVIGVSILYSLVIIPFRERVFEKEQAQRAEEEAYWDKAYAEVQKSKDAALELASSAREALKNKQDWLYEGYTLSSNSYYYKVKPLIAIAENHVEVLKNLLNSLEKVNSIRYQMLIAIENHDQAALDALAIEESDAVDDLMYWAEQEKKAADQSSGIQGETVKSIYN